VIRTIRSSPARDAGLLFDPPDGYRFSGGYLVTYELSIDTLLRRVLAPLVNADPDEPLEVGRAEPKMTVAYHREHPGPIMPSWTVELVRVSQHDGRPLHAKGGLLRFEPDDGRQQPLLRGWIGSANLTEGGLRHNRELILSGQRAGTGADEVVDTAIALCRLVAIATGSTPALTKLLAGLRAPTGRARTRLLETVKAREPLLARVKPPERFDRLDIITPPFQSLGSGARVASALAPILPDSGSVHIYTSTNIPLTEEEEEFRATAFSSTLVESLGERGLEVVVHFTPDVRDGQRRPLHAKAFVLHGSAKSVVLIGSANCTISGLGGGNREAMAIVQLDRTDAELLVYGGFEGWSWTGLGLEETLLTKRDFDPPTAGELFPEAYASLQPDAANVADAARGRWTGKLTVTGLEPGAKVTVGVGGRYGQAVVAADGTVDVAAAFGVMNIELLPEQGTVTITTAENQILNLVVYVDATRDWYIKMLEMRDRPPRSRPTRDVHELQLLLRGLRQVRSARFNLAMPTATGGSLADDRLSLPLDRRFDFLARHVSRLPAWADNDLLRTFLDVDEGDPRFEVASAIRSTEIEPSELPLLALLQDAVRDRDRRRI
jgi:hypothetical protein